MGECKGVFKNLPNNYDGRFFKKIVDGFKPFIICYLNTPLKYSQNFYTDRESIPATKTLRICLKPKIGISCIIC